MKRAAARSRCHVTLGEVTLTAIVDRVIYTASDRYPLLSALKVEEAGVHFVQSPPQAGVADESHLAEAVRFVLVEFLTVLGNLTGEILTPALHAELAKVAIETEHSEKHPRTQIGVTTGNDDAEGATS
jgi:hypothetical protein